MSKILKLVSSMTLSLLLLFCGNISAEGDSLSSSVVQESVAAEAQNL